MIRLMLGKMGSGKTACMVREMIKSLDDKTTYSNIIIKKNKQNVKQIKRDMIFKDQVVKVKKDGEPVTKKVFNSDYWKKTREEHPEGINVVIDEAHTMMDSRRSMSTDNVIMNDFMALLRRILGDSGEGYGELVLITQIGRRLDINARELATSIHYHVAHYIRYCKDCGLEFKENNEVYNKPKTCPYCKSRKLRKKNFVIEKWEFEDIEEFNLWMENRIKTYKKHYFITDVEQYFKYYDTFQWENLISEY